MATSGNYNFSPNLGEAVIAAYSRCGIRRTEIVQQHMADAAMESNLLMTSMQGDGINLWQVTLEKQDLHAGQGEYFVDPNVVFMLDVYIRQNPQNYGVNWDNNNANSQQWINNQLGEKPWTQGGNIQVVPPQSTATIDRLILPLSRSDYASIANKYMTGFPTSYWYDKLLQPKMYLWPVPNLDVVQGLQYYVQKRPQTCELQDGTNIFIPYEVFDYFIWALSERLAFIYAPDKVAMIAPRKQQAYMSYLQATTENVNINMNIEMKSYFRVG
jgi:hypothetical protein